MRLSVAATRSVERTPRTRRRVDRLPPAEAKRELQQVRRFLVDELLPHEKSEDDRVYPLVATLIGGEDPTAPMSRGHLEIARLVRVYSRLLEEIGDDVPDAEDLRELRRVLYGLHAILKLHFAQEEELLASLTTDLLAPIQSLDRSGPVASCLGTAIAQAPSPRPYPLGGSHGRRTDADTTDHRRAVR